MRILSDLLACLRFYSRLPVPVLPFETAPHGMLDFARAIRVLPVAGAVISAPAAVVLAVCGSVLPAEIAAGLTLAALVATTGAFHEDGLADTADGFGGGRTLERKLEIMRDSRIGTFGGAALVLSLLLRWAALTTLIKAGGGLAVAAFVSAAALSRWMGLLPLALLPPARKDGAAWAAAQPQPRVLAIGGLLALAAAFLPCLEGIGPAQALLASGIALLGALAMAWISHRQIHGQTGDVAGAAQQVAEILLLTSLCARV